MFTAAHGCNVTKNPPLCITTSAPHLNGSWSGGGPNVESTINLPPTACTWTNGAEDKLNFNSDPTKEEADLVSVVLDVP